MIKFLIKKTFFKDVERRLFFMGKIKTLLRLVFYFYRQSKIALRGNINQRGIIIKFSIIIANFNRERFLSKCIESALAQTIDNYEILIVDDGSSDNSDKVVNSFNSKKIRYIKKEHTGCWNTKNFGIEKSKGRYLCFLDSDDFLSEDYLEKADFYVEKFPNFEYYYPTQMKIIKENKLLDKIWRYVDFPLQERWRLINLFFHSLIGGIPHGGAIISRDVFTKNGKYDDSLYNFADSVFIIKNALKIKFKLCSELEFYFRRQHGNNLCTNLDRRIEIIIDLLDYCIENYDSTYIFPELASIRDLEERQKVFYQKVIEFIHENSEKIPKYKKKFLHLARKQVIKLRNL